MTFQKPLMASCALASAVFLLASCGTESASTGQSFPISATQPPSNVTKAAPGDTVAIDYILKLDDGKTFDTTLSDVAPESTKYDSKRTYSPLLVQLGSGRVPV